MLLNCSKHSTQFHPTHAKVKIGGYEDTIENHSMVARRVLKEGNIVAPISSEETDEYPTVGFVVRGLLLPMEYYPYYLGLIWHKYLMTHPKLVDELKLYTQFRDYEQFTIFSHAEIIAKFIGFNAVKVESRSDRKGKPGELLLEWCRPLTQLLKKETVVLIEEERPLTESINELVAFFHQVDTPTLEQSPELYRSFCSTPYRQFKKALRYDASQLIGGCFIRRNEQGNLQQFLNSYTKNYRNGRQMVGFLGVTKEFDELAFIGAVSSLKTYAKGRNLAVSIPYDLGCASINTDEWQKRYQIIENLFKDYYITLHKKI